MKDAALMSAVSQEVRSKRNELGLTQEDVADAVCISVRCFQMIESGKRLPSFSVSLRLTNLLSLDYKLLLRTVGEDVLVCAG